MVDSIAAGNSKDALQKLRDVLNHNHYLKVNTMIVRQIRLLLAGSIVRKRGGKVEDFMKVTQINNPYVGNKIFRQASNFSQERLSVALEECLQTDMALKRSNDSHLLLEMMVISLCDKIKS